jgi:hypothetical protein
VIKSSYTHSSKLTPNAANRGIDVVADSLTTAPEDLSGLSKNAPEYGYGANQSIEKSTQSHDLKEVATHDVNDGIARPTEEERTTLRRVSGSIPWVAYSLCAVEFAERASYYGCSFVFSNFVQFPLP